MARPSHNFSGTPDVGSIPRLCWDEKPSERTAPDGRPWLKCCDECAFKDRTLIVPIEETCREKAAAFYCIHRETVGGHNRVCAGFAARAGRSTPTPSTQEAEAPMTQKGGE